MSSVNASPWPVYERHVLASEAIKSGERVDMKGVAKRLAEYLLQNGLIIEHGPHESEGAAAKEYRFVIYTLKAQRGLP